MKIPKQAKYNPAEEDSRLGYYYVSVVDGNEFGILLGPFSKHKDALDQVDWARDEAYKHDPKAHFYGYGTLRMETPFAGTPVLQKFWKEKTV